jgi:hypothetical protein
MFRTRRRPYRRAWALLLVTLGALAAVVPTGCVPLPT